MKNKAIWFIVPAYNEERNIVSLLERTEEKMRAMGLDYHMIIVNDGSTDGTRQVVERYMERMPVRVINHDANKGVGEAFRDGFELALKESAGGDIIVTKESDNTSDLAVLDDMLKKIDGGYDMVLASCYAKGGGIIGTSFDRRFLSAVANLLLRIFSPIDGVRTYSSFYRAYRSDSIKAAFDAYGGALITEKGFACMVEMLINLSRLPIRIVEVPMILRCNLRKGSSKMKKRQTMLAYLRLLAAKFIRDFSETDKFGKKYAAIISSRESHDGPEIRQV